ncbi:ATP-binding cassette domain-containing protein [Glycomyces xiaoerkulensis]|uniref:ATP-binding cassette domain-containing protein n=1 Tax=Glycomyces xiaoerkulensis TaxID=2038139 RepID=UPI0022B7F886|nr:ATP-binding cassette domain-containing protein [Glycomyces xiaoerkulensis]
MRRRYKNFTALDSIDLEIEAGEAVAYVGSNGAGKSTTVKLLTGILEPTEGTGRLSAAWAVGPLVAAVVLVAVATGVTCAGLRNYDSTGH